MPLWLISLLLLTFAIGTDDFVIAGLLSEIATDLDVSEALAGQLVTVFALVYALAAPLAASLTARISRRTLLITLSGCFAMVNLLTAIAPSYGMLLAMRVLAAILAGAATPAAFASAADLAPAGRSGRYLGAVQTGLTLSLVAGVPVGTWIGGAAHWRWSLSVVIVLSLLAMIGLAASLPGSATPVTAGLRTRLAPLGRPAILVGLVGTITGGAGAMMFYSYIAPIARDLTGAGPTALGTLIVIAGVAALLGSVWGGHATDAWGASRTIAAALIGQMVVTFTLAAASLLTSPAAVPLLLVAALVAGWGVTGFALNPPVQSRILGLSGEGAGEAIALNAGALYLGISLGGAIGGVALAEYGPAAVTVAAGALLAVSVLVFLFAFGALDPLHRARMTRADPSQDIDEHRPARQ
ncbi:hypothetical protein B0T46_14700 [Nocardia donostiensis]|uniref:Major facilitator superfamily (MFS) profile domain-containing protein n=1 Tax=Nocardia donostiensis TaxID=1538463 RepID=A0A1W0B1I5_9NOCA|nr:hypothetical protein B0T46_14700 [Nocardia donostiensis]OQS16350.1 hypothetical protein B0T36_06245 [Nocardia donostiensis]